VFYWPGTSSATLSRVLWGDSGSTFAFSEMGAGFYELGSMTVFQGAGSTRLRYNPRP
jgi:hypothetical protein